MARPRNLFTKERVAGILGGDLDQLMDIAIELEPDDGCLTVFGPGERWLYALTNDGIENLKNLIHTLRTFLTEPPNIRVDHRIGTAGLPGAGK